MDFTNMQKIIRAIGLTTLAIATQAMPASAQFVNFREDGSPAAFLFRSASGGLAPGSEIMYTLSQQTRHIAVGTPNACGYKIISPGSNATGINYVHPSAGAIINTTDLPSFDGKCSTSTSGSALVPTTAGAAIPTSHYKQPDGKIAIKIDPSWTYLSVSYANVSKTVKAGKCGEVRVAIPTAKPGERPINWTGTINIAGLADNTDLELVNQDGRDAICSSRWNNTGGTKIPTWFFQFQ